MLRRGFTAALLTAPIACATAGRRRRSYLERRAAHVTKLHKHGPSPGKWRPQPVPAGVTELRYEASGRSLLAWFAAPQVPDRAPALIYFHGEFSFAAWDFLQVRPFLEAGYCVMTPTLRGENGDSGDFELLYGEVEDARAAVRWLAARPEVDASRIYTLGHSVGGGLSALLALQADLPVVCTASIGGIYTPATFSKWARDADTRDLVRFDPEDRDEVELRVMGPHLAELKRPHRAYVGAGDGGILDNARALAQRAPVVHAQYTLTEVPGDHAGSLASGISAYLRDLARLAEAPNPPQPPQPPRPGDAS